MKRSPEHASNYMNEFFEHLPSDQRKKALIDRKIKQIHQQFSECVDPFILQHVNSVYLTKERTEESEDVSRETKLTLTVYVDNSLVAAELNAQRELVVLKYRESFAIEIDEFKIKISRGAYLENHPFEDRTNPLPQKIRRLTPEEEQEITAMTASITDEDIRASFQRAVIATKEHFPKD